MMKIIRLTSLANLLDTTIDKIKPLLKSKPKECTFKHDNIIYISIDYAKDIVTILNCKQDLDVPKIHQKLDDFVP